MTPPVVTIITPLHNGADFVRRAIGSVRGQSFTDWQHLVINDRSRDGGDEVARQLSAEDQRLIVLDSEGPGAPSTRNTGIKAAAGRYIAFLDCDDYWAPEKLKTQISHMQAHDLVFSWSSYEVVGPTGEIVRTQAAEPSSTIADILTHRTVIGCLTAVYDREKLGTMLMPQIRMRQDLCLFWAILKRCEDLGLTAGGITTPLAFHQIHENNMTRNKAVAASYQWRAFRDVMGLSLPQSVFYFAQYAANSIMHRARRSPTPGGGH